MKVYRNLRTIILVFMLTTACGTVDENSTVDNSKDSEPNAYLDDTDTNTKPKPNGTMTSNAGIECGKANCTADLNTARTALINGDYTAAFAQYRCGDTVEAAAGAAITKLATIVQGEAVTQIMSNFGSQTPLSFADLIGKNGLLYQIGNFSDAGASLELSNNTAVNIDTRISMNDHADEPQFSSIDEEYQTPLPSIMVHGSRHRRDQYQRFQMELQPRIAFVQGDIIAFEYNCEQQYFETDAITSEIEINVSTRNGTQETSCRFTTNSLPSCPDRVGAIEFISLGKTGERATLQFTDIPLSCSVNEQDTYEIVYFSGTVGGPLHDTNQLDLTHMHPMFSNFNDEFKGVLPSLTMNQLIAHAAPLKAAFDEAACYANKADNGSNGAVFVFPEELSGDVAIPLTTRDTKLMATIFYGISAGIQIANSYDVPLKLGAMNQMTNAELVAEFNANLGSLKETHQIKEAGETFLLAATSIIAAVASKEDFGILRSNSYTAYGENLINQYGQFFHNSLSKGLTAFPLTHPAVMVNAKALFSNPPNPINMNSDPLVLEVDPEWGDEYINGVELFYQELLQDIVPNFSYQMDDNYWGEDELEKLEETGEEWFYALCEYWGC